MIEEISFGASIRHHHRQDATRIISSRRFTRRMGESAEQAKARYLAEHPERAEDELIFVGWRDDPPGSPERPMKSPPPGAL